MVAHLSIGFPLRKGLETALNFDLKSTLSAMSDMDSDNVKKTPIDARFRAVSRRVDGTVMGRGQTKRTRTGPGAAKRVLSHWSWGIQCSFPHTLSFVL